VVETQERAVQRVVTMTERLAEINAHLEFRAFEIITGEHSAIHSRLVMTVKRPCLQRIDSEHPAKDIR